MKPKSFDYVKVSNLNELLVLIDENNGNSKILAGGQSLVPMLNMRLAQPDVLIDVNSVAELDFISWERNELRVGALSRQQKLLESEIIKQKVPLLAEAIKHIGHKVIRNRGTIGGSLVHNDPSAELGVALMCLGAQVMIRNRGNERKVPLEDFFVTTFVTDISKDEILYEVCIPTQSKKAGFSFKELSKRTGDFAIVDAACILETEKDGKITEVSVALGGAGECPLLVDLSHILIGAKIDENVLKQVGQEVKDQVNPVADNLASGEYKKNLAEELAKRCIAEAYEMSLAN